MPYLTPSVALEAARELRESIDALAADWPSAYRHLMNARRGWGSSTLHGDNRTGGDHSDPVAQAALTPDVAAWRLERAQWLVARMVVCARELDRIRREERNYEHPPRPCGNPKGCPEGRPAADRRLRCHPCDQWKRLHGEERTAEDLARSRDQRRTG